MKTATAARKPARYGAEDGSTAVEAAIVLGIFFFLIAGIIEFAFVYWVSNSMLLAAEAAGRYAMVTYTAPSASCNTSIGALENCAVTVAQNNLPALDASQFTITPSQGTLADGTTSLTITVTYNVDFLGSAFLTNGPLTLTREVTVPLL